MELHCDVVPRIVAFALTIIIGVLFRNPESNSAHGVLLLEVFKSSSSRRTAQ